MHHCYLNILYSFKGFKYVLCRIYFYSNVEVYRCYILKCTEIKRLGIEAANCQTLINGSHYVIQSTHEIIWVR